MSNRLSQEKSRYLQQHASNPVDWYPWGEEAFAKARSEDKPIFLSSGYSSCHWCHVMAHESFESLDIARLMNEWFVCIKVDREERPDVDQLYQNTVALMGKGGGWPLTVFLTPELLPFFAGTYYPPADAPGRPSLSRLLFSMHKAWHDDRESVEAQATAFRKGLTKIGSFGLDHGKAEVVNRDDIVTMGNHIEQDADTVHGGFGISTKFPQVAPLSLLLHVCRRTKKESMERAVMKTLSCMASGGIFDHLGGGFHRYTVDRKWVQPHFEKMLYDNSQLIFLYAQAHQVSSNSMWRRVVVETIEYIRREMIDARWGTFYSSQDADSEGEEGKFFVWTLDEIRNLFPDKHMRTLVVERFGITEKGNFEEGKNILTLATSMEALAARHRCSLESVVSVLEEARRILFNERRSRVPPVTDKKVLTGWNGLMIRGLAFAGWVFHREDWIKLAETTAESIMKHLWNPITKVLIRVAEDGKASNIEGVIEDYGGLALGLVQLYQATFNPIHLEWAKDITREANEKFWVQKQLGFLTATSDLVVPTYASMDNAVPSGASMLTEASLRLAALCEDQSFLNPHTTYIAHLTRHLRDRPMAFAFLACTADLVVSGSPSAVIDEKQIGVETPDSKPLLDVMRSTFCPALSIRLNMDNNRVESQASITICKDFVCGRPISNPEDLRNALLDI